MGYDRVDNCFENSEFHSLAVALLSKDRNSRSGDIFLLWERQEQNEQSTWANEEKVRLQCEWMQVILTNSSPRPHAENSGAMWPSHNGINMNVSRSISGSQSDGEALLRELIIIDSPLRDHGQLTGRATWAAPLLCPGRAGGQSPPTVQLRAQCRIADVRRLRWFSKLDVWGLISQRQALKLRVLTWGWNPSLLKEKLQISSSLPVAGRCPGARGLGTSVGGSQGRIFLCRHLEPSKGKQWSEVAIMCQDIREFTGKLTNKIRKARNSVVLIQLTFSSSY
ncbi:uncharacterized protein LOC131808402 [Mustela lutreola]|uniref:uncharacterized protein LOC131808402 n=1 Tax=Mustela lutreola TaxID=9666 RepID=UPI0027971F17|nr:uncharacterized protein LOC131808402 [Mustela lutreola]